MAKPRTFAKKFSFAKLYGFCQIVWSSAELSANAVEKWVYHVTMSGIVSSNLFEKAAIMPYPDLIPVVSSKGEKYVRSEPNDTPRDNLLRLPGV